jgi:hypothetical protein
MIDGLVSYMIQEFPADGTQAFRLCQVILQTGDLVWMTDNANAEYAGLSRMAVRMLSPLGHGEMIRPVPAWKGYAMTGEPTVAQSAGIFQAC